MIMEKVKEIIFHIVFFILHIALIMLLGWLFQDYLPYIPSSWLFLVGLCYGFVYPFIAANVYDKWFY